MAVVVVIGAVVAVVFRVDADTVVVAVCVVFGALVDAKINKKVIEENFGIIG